VDTIFRGNVILPDRVQANSAIRTAGGKIVAVGAAAAGGAAGEVIDAGEGYIAPGFVDLHVHGGAGADFMDGTDSAFRAALTCHARHGTTSLAATTTVGASSGSRRRRARE
jgi:N-acetylglucosamine-6-phosphate deacetylase